MKSSLPIQLPRPELEEFCRRNHIRRLGLFGSVLREDFGPKSDVDVLVEFEPDHVPGFLGFAGMEIELAELLGRKVDLLTPAFFRPAIRKQIMGEALVEYEQAQ
jgi:predicted nucleotidyltransferase